MRYSIHKAFLSFLLAVLCLVTAGCGGGSSGGGSSLASVRKYNHARNPGKSNWELCALLR